MVDTTRGAAFQARNLLESLLLGDRYRLARALGIEAAYVGSMGLYSRDRTAQIGALALQAGTEGGRPHGLAVAIGGYAVAQCLEGDWRSALEGCERADEIYRTQCPDATWERATTAIFIQTCLLRLGDFARAETHAAKVLQGALDRGDLFVDTWLAVRSGGFLHLVHDRPTEARRRVDEAMERWPSRGFQVPAFWAAHTRLMVDLYEGRPEVARVAALANVRSAWRSMLASLHELRVDGNVAIVRATLATHRSRRDPALLRAAAATVRKIRRERTRWSQPFAAAMDGAVLAHRGRTEEAAGALAVAAAGFDALEMPADAAAARIAAGRLTGGDEGAGLRDRGVAALGALGVEDPQRLADVMIPLP